MDEAPPHGTLEQRVEGAMKARRKYIVEHAQDLTPKQLRKLIAGDLSLDASSLDPLKQMIKTMAFDIVSSSVDVSPEGVGEEPEDGDAEVKQKRKKKAKKAKSKKPKLVPDMFSEASSANLGKLKKMLKEATIPIPPVLYSKNKTSESLEGALEDLLAKHGLNLLSSRKDVQKVRRKREREKDLDGIDVSNIITGDAEKKPKRCRAKNVNYSGMEAGGWEDDLFDEVVGNTAGGNAVLDESE